MPRPPAPGMALAAFLAAMALAIAAPAQERQLPDLDYVFANDSPAYPPGAGPLIALSNHNSPMVQRGAFDPLLRLAATDGFRAERRDGELATVVAAQPAVLILANAHAGNFADFPAIEPPSAFSDGDIAAVRRWVEEGGGLLILADHAPFGGGASALAAAFGFTFLNGHAVEARAAAEGTVRVNIEFTAGNGLATGHPVTDGSTGRAPVGRFFAFGGQAFIPPDGATTLLTIPDGWQAVFSYRIRAELNSAPRIDASGMAQGAAMDYGSGRVAVFGEAGGFTAQVLDGTLRFGFNSREGAENPELVLSVLRWLAGYAPAD